MKVGKGYFWVIHVSFFLFSSSQTAILLLRIDDIVSGSKKKDRSDEAQAAKPSEEAIKE